MNSPSSLEIPAAGLKYLSFLNVYSALQRTTQNPQKAVWKGGNGWTGPVHFVSLGSCTDCWLTTPLTHLVVSPHSRDKITSSHPKMSLGCSFMRCGEGAEKKENWSANYFVRKRATQQTQLAESKQHWHLHQMQLLKLYQNCRKRHFARDLLIQANSPSKSSSKSSTKNSRNGGRFGLFRVLSSCWILEETRLLTATPAQSDWRTRRGDEWKDIDRI